MQRKKIKNKHKGHLLIIGVLLILIGIGTLIYKYYQRSEISNIEENNLIEFYEIHEDISVNQEEFDKKTDEVQEEVKVEKNVEKESYLAVLKIDKIKLERGIYNINSKNNNVNKNIKILKESDMPDKENGNVIIVGHSGSSYIAYFKNLVKLNNGDEAKIFYNGKTYIYNLTKSYEIEKTGKIALSKNKDKQTLTLITCKTNTNKQIVFVFELKNII